MRPIDGLLIDIDGVLVVSWEPIAGAAEALGRLRAAQVPIRFATNTTSRTRPQIADALTDAGMPVEPDEILTATVATASYLRVHHPGARCLVLNEGDLTEDMAGVEMTTSAPADVVVIGGAGPAFSYEAVTEAFTLVNAGAPLVAMHRNLVWQTRDGLALDTGFYVTAIEQAAGVEATVVGKPAAAFFAAGAAALDLEPSQVAMVGDDVVSDVLGAQEAGMTGVLVKTGKFRPESLEGLDAGPEVTLESFADVPETLGLSG